MTVTPETRWRETGDTTTAGLIAEFRRLDDVAWAAGYQTTSPLIAHVADLIASSRGLSRLLAAQSFSEQKHAMVPDRSHAAAGATLVTVVPNGNHNFLSLKLRTVGQTTEWRQFESYAGCAGFWANRILDPAGPYAGTVTIRDFIEVYAPSDDGNDVARYCREVCEIINRLPVASDSGPSPRSADRSAAIDMTRGLIPMPLIHDHLIGFKPEGVGWDDLGPRTVRGVVLHRMQGTLQSTYDHFTNQTVGALTDYGINSRTGEIWRYNDPLGRRSGWASGRVSRPYGDGKAFVDRYGLDAVNRDQLSLEFDGYFRQPGEEERESPISPEAIAATAAFIAPWAHDHGIPWTEFPIAPRDGFSFVRWHQEFTIGTGKVCPGETIMGATQAIIDATREILRTYQTHGESHRPPRPEHTVRHEPPVTIDLPPGVTEEMVAGWFGQVRSVGDRPMTFRFDPDGPVSRVWLARGQETGEWPPLVSVTESDGGRVFRFEGGWTVIGRANGVIQEVHA